MDSLLQAAPYFLLLSLSFVSLFLSLARLHVFLPIGREELVKGALPGIDRVFPAVLLLGFFTALSGTVGLIAVSKGEDVNNPGIYFVGQKLLEIFVQLGLGLCLLYFLDPRIIPHISSELPVRGDTIRLHNQIFSVLIFISWVISVASVFSPVPPFVPQILLAITCCFPIPLILLFARRQTVFHLRGWLLLFFVQISGCASTCFASVQSPASLTVHAVFSVVWIGGMMTLFQMLCIPIGMEISLEREPRHVSEEDFRSLHDPFMSPRSPGTMSISRITATAWSESQRRSYTHSMASTPELSPKRTPRRHKSANFPEAETEAKETSMECPSPSEKKRSRRTFSEPMLPSLLAAGRPVSQVFIDDQPSEATPEIRWKSMQTETDSQATPRVRSPDPQYQRRTPPVWYMGEPDITASVQYALTEEYIREGFRPPNSPRPAMRNIEPFPQI